MSNLREAAQQALEALVAAYQGKDKQGQVTEAITALRERLAQPEQEPVATVESVATVVSESGNQEVTMSWWHEPALPVGTKLYTTPPQRKPLTDEEILDATCHLGGWNIDVARCVINHARAIEAAHDIKGEA